jgi:hypothetical protein
VRDGYLTTGLATAAYFGSDAINAWIIKNISGFYVDRLIQLLLLWLTRPKAGVDYRSLPMAGQGSHLQPRRGDISSRQSSCTNGIDILQASIGVL